MATQTKARTADGYDLHVEATGRGTPLLFIHEFAGDHRSWEPQVRAFSGDYRCITYAARGYLPSDVPRTASEYSQSHAVADAVAVLDSLGLSDAHLIGLSMGGFCALHLALEYPGRTRSLAIAGVGYGANDGSREAFRRESELLADAFDNEGSRAAAERYSVGPARVQFERKDSRGHAGFARMMGEHSALGSALTLRGVQKERPSLFSLRDRFTTLTAPTLIMVGDEDEGAVAASLMMKRAIPSAGLAMFPKSGHTLNLEEPVLFNETVRRFLIEVESGSWGQRDPRSLESTMLANS